MTSPLRVGIVGASGYGGGELLRLLLQHPKVEVALATSNKFAGKNVRAAHPNLRGVDLTFATHDAAETTDLDALFLAGPHGTSAPKIRAYLKTARRVFDLAADHRLADASQYPRFYEGWTHPDPELLSERVYGIAEFHREKIRSARLVAGAGCIATSAAFALRPLARRGLIDPDHVVVDSKIGSSAAGAEHSPGSHHPERSGAVRPYSPAGHRHTAEIQQETGVKVSLSAHAVELVRGILSTCHVWLKEDLDEKAIWKVFREDYGAEPMVQIVKERSGLYRLPEPKLVIGTNNVAVGFERDPLSKRLVVLSAIDNLVRGTAGAAVQNMNVAFGYPETEGLPRFALHP
ncbi:MAG TPA: N-acetyl-gamma-glutamyl-phosphate reductase [Candidatus Thermoplasmatota archaeon]|nr:N-acetyl-gamma-glutamyl-phosphate reductase [Candidatus Thermoplasmatota archaeon]